MKVKKIIFDLDDTLLFLSDEWLSLYNDFINKYDLNITVEDLYFTIDKKEKENPDTYISEDNLIDYINSSLSVNIDKEMFRELLDGYAKLPLLKLDIVEDVLSYLSSKYELVSYSNWFSDNQLLRLKLNGLAKYFSKVYGWDTLPVKPSKRGLEEIIGNNSLEDYLFIGDNIDIDIKLPNSIGMKTIFYNHKNITQDKYREIRNIEDLKNIL